MVDWKVALLKEKAWLLERQGQQSSYGDCGTTRNEGGVAHVLLCRSCFTAAKCENEEHHGPSGNALPCVTHLGKITNKASVSVYFVCSACGRTPTGTADSR